MSAHATVCCACNVEALFVQMFMCFSCFKVTVYCRWMHRSTNRMKGHAHPRMYYKCTAPRCLARKHTEMTGNDDTQLVTTYVGTHIHPIPAAGSDDRNEGIDYSRGPPAADGRTRGAYHRMLRLTCCASTQCLPCMNKLSSR